MNTLYIIRKTVFQVLMIAVLGLAGCLRDGADDITPVPPAAAGVTMNIAVPGMQNATRAGFSDVAVDELDVLVFDASDILVEHKPVTIIKTGLGGGAVTQGYAPITTAAGYTVAVAANFRASLDAGVSVGMSRDAVRNLQVRQKNDSNRDNILWNMNKALPESLPMYGETALTSAIPANQALDVKLTRVHARIDFQMKDAASSMNQFIFRWFQKSGSLAFDGTFQNAGRDCYPEFPVAGPELKNAEGFYLFEEAAQTGDAGSNAFIVVSAKYNGTYYFYRVDFVSDGSLPGYAKGEFMPLLRNYRYKIVINNVLGPGYKSFTDAGKSSGEVNNLRYTILTENEEAGNIAYDGGYYLSVDKKEFEVPKLGVSDPDFLEISVRSNYAPSSSYSWKVTKSDPGILPVGLETDQAMTFFSGPAYITGKIRFRVEPNPGSADRELTFTVGAGKLAQVITVRQSGTPVNAYINAEQLPGEFLYYSWNGELLEDYKSQLMLDWVSSNRTVTVQSSVDPVPGGYPFGTQYKPFEFSTAWGYDDLTAARTYTGSKKLLNIAPKPISFVYESSPLRSTIRVTAKGDNGTVTRDISVKHKNICVYIANAGQVYVASDKLSQIVNVIYTTNCTLSMVSDPMGVTRNFTPQSWTLSSHFNNPFDYSGGPGTGGFVNFHTRSVADLGSGCTATFNLSSPLYAGYGGTKSFNFDIKIIPVGERANSYIVKPGEYVPAIPLSQANQTVELGPNWIDLSDGVSGTKPISAAVEWSDSSGVVELEWTGAVRYTYEGYTGPKEAYLVVKGVKEGNAVVTVSQSGVKKWSWHIWVTADKDVIGAGTGSGNRWMDRNLGALAATPYVNSVYSEDQFAKTTGMFYQWGRKDAFPAVNQYYAGGTTLTEFSNANNALDVVINAAEAVKNPLKFCSEPFGWEGSGGAASWNNGGKSVYDPCPVGWKLPALSDLPVVPVYVNTITDNMVLHSSLGIKFPLTGYRFRTNLLQAKYEAYIWYNAGYPGHAGQYSANIYGMDTSGIAHSNVSVPTFGMMNVRCVRIPM